MEVWKDIKGFEQKYQVSNLSRVRSLKRCVKNKDSFKVVGGIILKQQKTNKGYKRVTISVNQKSKSFLVHRLVANAFIPNPYNLDLINHKDENPSNNSIDNLEWCDHKYNINYGTGLKRRIKTNTNGKCSKKVYQYKNDILVNIYPSASECKRNGYSQGHVSACCRGERKTHKSYTWSYEKM